MSSSNTDFDATLVDWLYGELDAEATASFEAHLEAHPEHKAEAEALRETRAAFQGLPDAEPSSSLTPMLMQKAAEAAQPKGGVWAAITGFFEPVFMHPAAMAMATIVVVAGVAGTLYLRNGKDMVAETTVAKSEATPPTRSELEPSPVAAGTGERREMDELAAANEESEASPAEPMEQGFAADLATEEQEKSLRAAREIAAGEDGDYRSLDEKDAPGGALDRGGAGYAFDQNATSNAISGGAIGYGDTAMDRDAEGIATKSPSPELKLSQDSAPKKATSAGRRARAVPSKNDDAKPTTSAKKSGGWENEQVESFQVAARSKRCRDAGRIANDLLDKNPAAYERSIRGTQEESDCSYLIASETKRRKSARSKKAVAKSKKKDTRKKGQGESVPKNAVAAPKRSLESVDEPAQANGL